MMNFAVKYWRGRKEENSFSMHRTEFSWNDLLLSTNFQTDLPEYQQMVIALVPRDVCVFEFWKISGPCPNWVLYVLHVVK